MKRSDMDVAVSFNPKFYDPCTYSKMYQEVVVTACISLQHAYELENAIALYASGKLFFFCSLHYSACKYTCSY